MNESDNTAFINRRIRNAGFYALKIQTMMNNGVPDCWYSGPKSDLWVEMKYLKKLPKKESTKINVNLTELQLKWLIDRGKEGRNVCVILATPIGYAILTLPFIWENKVTQSDLIYTRDQVIEWIIQRISG